MGDNRIQLIIEAANRTQAAFDSLKKDIDQSTGHTSTLADAFGNLRGVINLAVAAFSAWAVAKYAQDAALLAARVETLGVVMKVVGANAGYTAAQMDGFVQQVKGMGITTQESMNSLTKMAGAQMDLTKASGLARVAQDAAVIGGINSSEAFGRMIQGIKSGEIEILKTIGINVSFEQSYKKMADQLGKSTKDLTETEKVTARMNGTLDFGQNIAGAYAASMDTAGKQIMSLARPLEEIKLKLGETFTPVLSFAVLEITRFLKDMDTQLGNNKPGIEAWGQKFKEVVVSIAVEVTRLSMLLDKAGGSLTSAGMLLFGPGAALGNANSKKQFEMLAAANMEYEKRYKEGEERLQRLADSLMPRGTGGRTSAQEQASIDAAAKRKEQEEALAKARKAEKERKNYTLSGPTTEVEMLKQESEYIKSLLKEQKDAAKLAGDAMSAAYRDVSEEAELTALWAKQAGDAMSQSYKDAAEEAELLAKWQKEAFDRSPVGGMINALRQYADESANIGRQMEGAFLGVFDSMEDVLVRFAQTSKLNFSDMANSIIADLFRIQLRASITGPLSSGLNSLISGMFSGGGPAQGATPGADGVSLSSAGYSWGPPVFHNGGMVVPRFHFGGLASDEVPAILQTRERVLSREQAGLFEKFANKTGGGSPSSVVVTIVNPPGEKNEVVSSSMRVDGEQIIVEAVLRKMRSDPGTRAAFAGGGNF